MKLYVTYEAEEQLDFDYTKLAATVGEAILETEHFPSKTEVNLVLTSDEEIHRVNREFRDIDSPTDVLSFPAVDFENPGDYPEYPDWKNTYKNPDTGNIILGDIMISVPKSISQAHLYGHSVRREYSFLFAHSMLHLLGYDHMEPDQARVMEEKQEKILQNLGISR